MYDFKEFHKQALSEEIVIEILKNIKLGKLKPGDKLPPEREFCTMLGVSRPSLREAFRALSIMNILEIRQGAGVFITSLKPELLLEHLDFVFSLDDSTILELFAARKIVEPGIAKIAAQNISDEEIVELKELVEQAKKHSDDYPKFLEIDIELHKKIAEISKNAFLKRLLASINQLTRASRTRTGQIPGALKKAAEDHERIMNAIISRDPELAGQTMLAHLENMEQNLQKEL